MKIEDRTRTNIEKLREEVENRSYLLIVLQDNPDPDAIGSAVALRKIVKKFGGVKCSIAHGGTIGRGENRALVRYLGLNLLNLNILDRTKFDLIATVDTQPGMGNNSLPADVTPELVFDHHRIRKESREADICDVRPRYGATSTIMTEYLCAAEIEIDIPLATALLYGVRSDTQDLGRETSRADIEAIEVLYPIANKRMLSQIQRGSVQREYWRMLAEALNNAVVYGDAVVAPLGKVDNPDMIAEVADLLLRDENINCTICYGFYEDKLLLSVRTESPEMRADKIARYIVARKGTGGGHPSYAGGQIPAADMTDKQIERLEKKVVHRALCAVHVDPDKRARLT
jgi:nanoRNase/pAp phosphatase (c-di-AMP/oligoRNAs hydrolase)